MMKETYLSLDPMTGETCSNPRRRPSEYSLLGKHQGRAHKLGIEPGSPHIVYTCGADGSVRHFDLRSSSATRLFTCKAFTSDRSTYMPTIHLNSIAIDPRNPNLFAVGGTDEFARLYDIHKYNWDESNDFDQPTDCFPLNI